MPPRRNLPHLKIQICDRASLGVITNILHLSIDWIVSEIVLRTKFHIHDTIARIVAARPAARQFQNMLYITILCKWRIGCEQAWALDGYWISIVKTFVFATMRGAQLMNSYAFRPCCDLHMYTRGANKTGAFSNLLGKSCRGCIPTFVGVYPVVIINCVHF